MNKLQNDLYNYLVKALEFPKEIHLESSSRCNSKCLTCPRDGMTRPLIEMDRNLFTKAVEETSAYDMDYIMLHLNGEPMFLSIDELVWRINYARKTNPKTNKILFFTNGSFLTEEAIDKLLCSKLDLIMISVDGGNKQDYENIRKGLSWDNLIISIIRLVKRKHELGSNLFIQTAIVPQKNNQNSVKEYFRLFQDIGVDHVAGSGVNNIGGYIDSDNMRLSTQKHTIKDVTLPCFKIFLDLSIMSDGSACVCAQDVRGDLIIGDLNKQSLKEIWQGNVLLGIRDAFVLGNKINIPFCSKCDFMAGFVSPDFWNIQLSEWIEVYENVKNSR